jgi:hypothetical protein
MPEPRSAYRGGTLVLSLLMIVVGVGLLVSTLARGGGPLAVGILFGLLFIAAGAARIFLLRKTQ